MAGELAEFSRDGRIEEGRFIKMFKKPQFKGTYAIPVEDINFSSGKS